MAGIDNEDKDAALLRFRRVFIEGAPFEQDRARAEELSLEARPAIDVLASSLRVGRGERADAIEHHEGLALVTLLGRRAGHLGVTPTAALALVPAITAALGRDVPDGLLRALHSVCLEGYVAGRDEALGEDSRRRLAQVQPILALGARCFALVLVGEHEAEALSAVVDRFARRLLQSDALVGIVDLENLLEPAPDRAAEVFGAHAAARMIGAQLIFSGASEAWLDAARKARVRFDEVQTTLRFSDAVQLAYRAAGHRVARDMFRFDLPRGVGDWLKRR